MAEGVETTGGVVLTGLCSPLRWRLDGPAENTHTLTLTHELLYRNQVFVTIY